MGLVLLSATRGSIVYGPEPRSAGAIRSERPAAAEIANPINQKGVLNSTDAVIICCRQELMTGHLRRVCAEPTLDVSFGVVSHHGCWVQRIAASPHKISRHLRVASAAVGEGSQSGH